MGKNSAAEISLKEEASIEYSSGTSDDSDEDEGESSQQEPEAEEEPLKKPKKEILVPSIVVSPVSTASISMDAKKAKMSNSTTKKAEIPTSMSKKKTPTVTMESTTSNASTEDDEAMPLPGAGSIPIKVENSENHVIPDAIRFDPAKSLENKPKGLVDSLTKYFTPGAKRTSRTALNSLIKPAVELQTPSPT